MKCAFKIALVVFAVIGVVCSALTVRFISAADKCEVMRSTAVRSPDARYFAVLEQNECEDPADAFSVVGMSTAENRAMQIIGMRVQGTREVALEWNGVEELVVRFPPSAEVVRYAPHEGWPQIVVQRGAPKLSP